MFLSLNEHYNIGYFPVVVLESIEAEIFYPFLTCVTPADLLLELERGPKMTL